MTFALSNAATNAPKTRSKKKAVFTRRRETLAKTALLARTTAGECMIVAEQRNNRRTRRRWARMRLETVRVALPDTHKQDHQKSTVAEPVIRQRANL